MKVIVIVIILLFLPFVMAANWYIRPDNYSEGENNGTSYTDAWQGLSNVTWGEGGVVAGDTLYVCDTWINTLSDRSYNNYKFTPGASGTSENYITIKSHPDHPAIIWGIYTDARAGGILPENWTEPNVPGCYYNETSDEVINQIYTDFGLYENFDGTSYDKYTKLDSAEEVIASTSKGVYFQDTYSVHSNRIWLKPFIQATFADNLYFSGTGGYLIEIGNSYNYIKYEGLTVHGALRDEGSYQYYIIEDCYFDCLSTGYGYRIQDGSYVTIDNCEFTNCGNGIYVAWADGDVHHITIQNCYFHHIGTPYQFDSDGPADKHTIGIQNHEHFYIYNNRFDTVGSAMDFHLGVTNVQKHIHVIGNYISNVYEALGTASPGCGIVFEGDAATPKANQDDYIVAYNIVVNCESWGICPSRKCKTKVYNNFVYNCGTSYVFRGMDDDGCSAEFYNNISLSPRTGTYHIYFNQNNDASPIAYDWECDNNLYYPTGDSDVFYFLYNGAIQIWGDPSNFTEWKACNLKAGDTVDGSSLTSDPLMKGFGHLAYNSPAIDAGVDVGYSEDFDGDSIISNPDMGADEFHYRLLITN